MCTAAKRKVKSGCSGYFEVLFKESGERRTDLAKANVCGLVFVEARAMVTMEDVNVGLANQHPTTPTSLL